MLALLLAGLAILALSGLPALLSRGRAGELASAALAVAGSLCGLVTVVATFRDGGALTGSVPWQLPYAALSIRLDPLAAAFLVPIFILGALASVYGLAYWPASEQRSAARVRLFSGLLLAGMAMVVIAAHAILFLFAWETMALASFFLIAADDRNAEVREAAWIYLVATHVGTLGLFAMFVVMRDLNGSFALGPVAGAGAIASTVIFLLAIFGFGFKAGIVPLHFWLPGAHANAPSHVSAILSGAMLKVGVYGLLRTLTWLDAPPLWWGGLLVALGLAGALVAITLAIGEGDMKRALAWSSVENVGIIVAAIGVATFGRAAEIPSLTAIGYAAAILHVWNHSLFKGLLFFGAGSVLHATGTRRIDAMGGLLRRMPVTGAAFVAGACGAAALPGANAFVSEALLYYGFFTVSTRGSMVALGAAVLALVGALAVVSFVRLTGTIFLGSARSASAEHSHEAPRLMTVPLGILAVAVLALGLVPTALVAPLDAVAPGTAAHAAPFLGAIALPVQIVAALSALAFLALLAATKRSPRALTWDCGYAAPTARMQYTGRSLGEWISERLMPGFLRPRSEGSTLSGAFPSPVDFAIVTREPFFEKLYLPAAERWARRAMRLRWVQHGRLPEYLLYIFLTLVAGLCWAIVYPLLGGWLR
jgi:formate hydrogenlyase subunit 3/multisubunit Na+/H+ antiporter MnhD subunit